MGTPLTRNKPGNACTICWGSSKPFGNGPTPHIVQMRLTSMLPGDNYTPELEQLLLTTHYLKQTLEPCIWEIRDGSFLWRYLLFPTLSQCEVFSGPPVRNSFTGTIASPCLTDFPNLSTAPADQVMYGGFANITWDPEDLL